MVSRSERWGDDAPSGDEEARQRLLDAAETCFARFGVARATVEDIAGAAKVSRATVYRYFGGKDDIIHGVLLREAERLADEIRALIEGRQFADAIVDAFVHLLDEIPRNPHLGPLFAVDAVGMTSVMATSSEAVLGVVRALLHPVVTAARERGELRADLVESEIDEWLLRVILSMLSVPPLPPRTAESNRAFLSQFLIRGLAGE